MDYSGLIDFKDFFDSVGIPTDFISIIFQRDRWKPPTSSHTVVKYTPVVKIVVNSETDLQWIDRSPILKVGWFIVLALPQLTWRHPTDIRGDLNESRGPIHCVSGACFRNAEIL